MEIKNFTKEMISDVVKLWNESVVPYSIFAEFTDESFAEKFLNNPFYDNDGSCVVVDKGKIIAFGNATYNNNGLEPEKTPGYITCVVVDKNYWRQGIGSKVLLHLESFLKSKKKTFIRTFFANPINLKWYVPGYHKHEHAGAPAVEINSPFYFLLMANGYNINGQQDAYHINLTNFQMPQKVLDKIAENEKEGYTITIYDEKKHHGFDELFDALGSEGWRQAINNNLAREKPLPILIVQKEGEILGFTGPINNEPSGRAYLAGVAIHPKAQARGLGKTMFCMLCQKSKENGSTFMTLFTGSDNKARNIYLYAGLRVVCSFAIMRKELV
ncbi:MAG TPA: GNAT family N-acetyltransferase [Bacilli bacterium]|nr:GNAT family N-acetyltransferase [Bacilli bacterium]